MKILIYILADLDILAREEYCQWAEATRVKAIETWENTPREIRNAEKPFRGELRWWALLRNLAGMTNPSEYVDL